MAYTNKAAIIQRFQQETHVLELLGATLWDAAAEAKLADLIAEADSEINPYLAMAVELPLTTTPDVITQAATRLVCYYLYRDADYHSDNNPRLESYKRTISLLKEIAAGKVLVLPVDRKKAGSVYLESETDPEPFEGKMTPSNLRGM